ncbi:MBL fold metallo-hydrolase [Pelosinus sp. sgz500959]|uniref:MBL fold metallo-hydrolase n=1 Tax=Pelosinus sp. sgz500959 TaxID=3242472 RepID=UPI00366F13F3
MEVQLLRHATLLVSINGKKLLVDPMLGEAGVMPPIVNSPNSQRNPLVELTLQLDWQDIDGVLLTHTHRDHFDDAAAEQLPRNIEILCQPEDEEKLKKLGFLRIHPIMDEFFWEGITIHRTAGQHGTGEIATQMAPVSGYVLESKGEPSLYIAGDTIYFQEITKIINTYQPNIIVVNAGGARFNIGDPITMTAEDVAAVCQAASTSKIIAVHMEAINHCLVSRADLRNHLKEEGLMDHVLIPMDGETSIFL